MEKNIIIALFITSAITTIGFTVLAKQNLVPATNKHSGKIVKIPSKAIEVSNNVFSLGTAQDMQSGKTVKGYAIVHPKENHGKDKPGRPDKNKGQSSCFDFLAKNAKWKTVEPWFINTENQSNLDSNFIINNLTSNIEKWEDAANGVINDYLSTDILGDGIITPFPLEADTTSPDGKNEVYFANIANEGVIGITIVWGVFDGNPSNRVLVEWDQVYDDFDFNWSATGENNKMDFENIATHELGHSIGMGHPDDSCTEETMYRYSTLGETKKRDLDNGDIAGTDKLY